MKAMNDATSALLRAVRGRFEGLDFTIEEVKSRSWASATFVGARHELSFRIEGERAQQAADAFLKDLDVAEFQLRGHVLADIALVSEERIDGGASVTVSLEALTVEDD
jgi:hypothetical protein